MLLAGVRRGPTLWWSQATAVFLYARHRYATICGMGADKLRGIGADKLRGMGADKLKDMPTDKLKNMGADKLKDMPTDRLKNKVTTVRFGEEQLAALVAMAMVNGDSMAEEIRQAVHDRIEAKRRDRKFLSRIEESRQRSLRALQVFTDH